MTVGCCYLLGNLFGHFILPVSSSITEEYGRNCRPVNDFFLTWVRTIARQMCALAMLCSHGRWRVCWGYGLTGRAENFAPLPGQPILGNPSVTKSHWVLRRRFRPCWVEEMHPHRPHALNPGFRAPPFDNPLRQFQRRQGLTSSMVALLCVCFVLLVLCVISVSVWLVSPGCPSDVPLLSPSFPSGCPLASWVKLKSLDPVTVACVPLLSLWMTASLHPPILSIDIW